jgi:hypothetical protein
MTIYAVLHHEHVRLLRLLDKTRRAPVAKRRELLAALVDELSAHTRAEEEVVYDRFVDVAALHVLTLAAREEHLVFTRILADLAVMSPDDERCEAKLSVLDAGFARHVAREEGALFAAARRVFSGPIAENFAGEYLAAKQGAMQISVEDRLIEALAMARFGGVATRGTAEEWSGETSFKGLSEEPTANGYARFSGNF